MEFSSQSPHQERLPDHSEKNIRDITPDRVLDDATVEEILVLAGKHPHAEGSKGASTSSSTTTCIFASPQTVVPTKQIELSDSDKVQWLANFFLEEAVLLIRPGVQHFCRMTAQPFDVSNALENMITLNAHRHSYMYETEDCDTDDMGDSDSCMSEIEEDDMVHSEEATNMDVVEDSEYNEDDLKYEIEFDDDHEIVDESDHDESDHDDYDEESIFVDYDMKKMATPMFDAFFTPVKKVMLSDEDFRMIAMGYLNCMPIQRKSLRKLKYAMFAFIVAKLK